MAGRATLPLGNRARRFASFGWIALALGCGGQSTSRETDDGERGGGGSPGGTGGASRGGGDGTAGGHGGTQISGIPNGGVWSGGAPSGGSSTGGTPTCDGEDLPQRCICAEMTMAIVFENFFVALDRSEAMAGERWNRALETLKAFFSDSRLHAVGMTLGTFPDTNPRTCDDVMCDPAACTAPLVELAKLTRQGPPQDMQEHALLDALRTLTPDGPAPPLPAALEGALQWAADHNDAQPEDDWHVILVASGALNACAETSVESARRAYLEHGILTHVLGFEDGDRAFLDGIASAGGTDRALMLGNDVEANAAELIRLAEVGSTDFSCQFPLTLPLDNLHLTNVRLTMTTVNGASVPLEQVAASSACSENGWHYDSPSNPKAFVLCPASCASMKARDYDMIEVSIACGL